MARPNGRRLPDEPRASTPSAPVGDPVACGGQPLSPALQVTLAPVAVPAEPDGTGLTVGDLCEMWSAWIQAERLTGKPARATSILFGARQAAAALRAHLAMRAADFGPIKRGRAARLSDHGRRGGSNAARDCRAEAMPRGDGEDAAGCGDGGVRLATANRRRSAAQTACGRRTGHPAA